MVGLSNNGFVKICTKTPEKVSERQILRGKQEIKSPRGTKERRKGQRASKKREEERRNRGEERKHREETEERREIMEDRRRTLFIFIQQNSVLLDDFSILGLEPRLQNLLYTRVLVIGFGRGNKFKTSEPRQLRNSFDRS
jgi:hypothetical protein